MGIKKLIERLRTESLYKDKATLEIMVCMDADAALSALQTENAKLRAELNDLRTQWDMYGGDVGITALMDELEQVKREYHQRLELDGIACKYCACYTDGCVQNDEEAEFCELWQWRGLEEG